MLDEEVKNTDSHLLFKKKIKSKLVDINKELPYF